MCPPVAAAVAIGATVAGGITKAAGSIYAGNMQAKIAGLNADMAEQNAAAANAQAADAIQLGSEQVSQHYLQAGQLRGQQAAAQAANGVELDYGSPLEVMADTSTMSEIDATTLRKNAKNQADAYRVQGVNYLNEAQVDRLGGQAAKIGGYIGAATSVIGAANQIAGSFVKGG